MIYKNGNKFFRMLAPPGSYPHRNYPECVGWALWRPVRRFLWVFWVKCGEDFWLEPGSDFRPYP